MATARQLTGWIWLIAPLAFLSFDVWSETNRDFINWGYYFFAWGGSLALAACGAWFLIGMPGAKWTMRIVAMTVALYLVLNFLIAWSNAPHYGGHDPTIYAVLGVTIAFCAFSFYIAGRNAA